MKRITLTDGTTLHLDAAQYRTVQFYARLHGVSLAQAVKDLAEREQKQKREVERARKLFARVK